MKELIKEYTDKLQQLQSGQISEIEWLEYCRSILLEIISQPPPVP